MANHDESKLVEDEVEVIFQSMEKLKRVMVPTNADAAALEALAKKHDSICHQRGTITK